MYKRCLKIHEEYNFKGRHTKLQLTEKFGNENIHRQNQFLERFI
jgi:hypothetical protein